MRRQEGFTLLELIVYVGILAVSAALLTGILSITLKVQNRESAANEVTSQLNFVMQNVNRLVRESSNIEIADSAATSTLKLRMKDSAKDPTCLSLVNGVIKLAEGPDPSNKQNCVSQTSDLTNDRVVVDTLNFTKFSQYPGHDTVSVDIQMTYNSQSPQQRLTREIRSAIARVSAATFDSNLLPGSASYTIGQSGSAWYDAFISNLLYLGRLSDDPTASQEGAIYYNTVSNAFRGYKPSGWANLGESLWTASGNNIYNSNSGNIGVNTNNPASRLSIKGNVSIGTGYASVAAPTNGMIVQGDVGIGTTNPGAKLEVVGNIIASDPTALDHLVTKAYAETNYKDPPGQWTCTLRSSTSGGTSATASCVGLEKVINGGCAFSSNWDDQRYDSRPTNQGWYCYNNGGNAVAAYANCCL